jgi:hypothetical protein
MASMRTYAGTIYLCSDCGQPAYTAADGDEDGLPLHFDEQWDGVECGDHPLAGQLITVVWERELLAELKRCYPDTHPSARPAGPRGPMCLPAMDIEDLDRRYGTAVMFAIAENNPTAACAAIARHLGAKLQDWIDVNDGPEHHAP